MSKQKKKQGEKKTAKDFGDAGDALIRAGKNARSTASSGETVHKQVESRDWR